MTIAAHQPNYLPNLAFFNKMKNVDKFIVITNLNFEKHEGWQQRHKIKGPSADMWLTTPVLGGQNQLICQVKINNNINWRKKQIRTLEIVYAKAKYKKFLPHFTKVLEKDWEFLPDLNYKLIELFKDILDITTDIKLDNEVSGKKHTLIINICKKYNADTYLSGAGARAYLTSDRLEEMKENGVSHIFTQNTLTKDYPYSTLHYLLTKGDKWVKNII